MLNRRISILDPKFPIPKTLDVCITEEHNVDYRPFSLLDRADSTYSPMDYCARMRCNHHLVRRKCA